jgi:hypothetical protein
MTTAHKDSGTELTVQERLGFRVGINGPHAARTMMLEELRLLLQEVPAAAEKGDYGRAIKELNVLGKPTSKARELSFRFLTALYGLDPSKPVFRALRRLWPSNESAQPMLALAVALARDPLLASTREFVLRQAIGADLSRERFEVFLSSTFPARFTAASLRSFAQNVAGTWTAAGLIDGRVRKLRATPQMHPESVAMLLFLGYLQGRSGQRLFSSAWTELLCCGPDEIESLASSASHRGFLTFLNAGGVKEVRFADFLTTDEERMRQELTHVI